MTNDKPVPPLAVEIVVWTRRLRDDGAELHRHLTSKGIPIPGWLNDAIPATSKVPAHETVAWAIGKAMQESDDADRG